MRGYRLSSALHIFPRVFRTAEIGRRATTKLGERGVGSLAETRSSLSKSLAEAAAVDSGLAEEFGSSAFDASRRVETGKPQSTLLKPVIKTGVGLHSGEISELRLVPAAAGDGRYFVVGDTDDSESFRVPAMICNVRETILSTCLGRGNFSIRTVEHLLSALEGLGVDNCRIEIRKGREVPLLDGSALEWVEAIEASGLSAAEDREGSHRSRRTIVLREPVSVWHGDSFVAGFPASTTRLTCGIDFPQVVVQKVVRMELWLPSVVLVQAIGQQWFTWSGDSKTYQREVAPARTFGIYEQISQLQAAGLIKGGSLENALVCSMEKGWLNPPLRFPDEPCRHKLLDLIGDLALCAHKGHPGLPVAHIIAYKASHALHVKFGESLFRAGLK